MAQPINSPSPRVLVFPLPSHGDLSPMLKLAQLLSLANFEVTFINTSYNHQRMTRHSDIEARFSQYPGFRFKIISDGLPEDHPRTGDAWLMELLHGLASNATPFLREKFSGSGQESRVTCVIIDGALTFVCGIAKEFGVPLIKFMGTGACLVWTHLCTSKLLEAGEIPVKDEDMDEMVQNIPGMTGFLRRRDLPSHFRVTGGSMNMNIIQFLINTLQTQEAHPLILNTFDELEGPVISHLQAHYPNIFCVGPLQAQLKYRLGPKEISLPNYSIWEDDRSCLSWLDQKPNKSVIYVSLGSLVCLTEAQFVEIWAGLVRSKRYFLWVVRPNLMIGDNPGSSEPDELVEGTKERGCIVGWAPQEVVLTHHAVGGFLTHSGWNSTLEGILAGVPMLCWPCFYDQLVVSRYVSEVWRIGLDMKDTCDRTIVEKMVNDLMEGRRYELESSMDRMSRLARDSVIEGGSSYCSLNRLIEDIKVMSKKEK